MLLPELHGVVPMVAAPVLLRKRETLRFSKPSGQMGYLPSGAMTAVLPGMTQDFAYIIYALISIISIWEQKILEL